MVYHEAGVGTQFRETNCNPFSQEGKKILLLFAMKQNALAFSSYIKFELSWFVTRHVKQKFLIFFSCFFIGIVFTGLVFCMVYTVYRVCLIRNSIGHIVKNSIMNCTVYEPVDRIQFFFTIKYVNIREWQFFWIISTTKWLLRLLHSAAELPVDEEYYTFLLHHCSFYRKT